LAKAAAIACVPCSHTVPRGAAGPAGFGVAGGRAAAGARSVSVPGSRVEESVRGEGALTGAARRGASVASVAGAVRGDGVRALRAGDPGSGGRLGRGPVLRSRGGPRRWPVEPGELGGLERIPAL